METWGVRHTQGCHACCCSLNRHKKDQQRRWGVLQDHERMFQPPMTQLASVEQREPKQAGRKVTSDTDLLFRWSRPKGWTETAVWQRGMDARDQGKRFYSVTVVASVLPLQRWDRWPSSYLQKWQLYPVIMEDEQLASQLQSVCYQPSTQQAIQSASC